MGRWFLCVCWIALALAGCGGRGGGDQGAQAAPAGDGPPRILILSSLVGYVEPCGCTIDLTLGGIDRVATVIEAARAEGPTLVLAVGPTLFDREEIPEHLKPQAEEKARLLAKSLSIIGVDAVVGAPEALTQGEALYRELRGLWHPTDVTANLSGGASLSPVQGAQILALGDLKVGVFGLADPEGPPPPGGEPTDPQAAALAAVAQLQEDGAQVIVALADLPRRDVRRLARKVKGVDFWALGDHPREQGLTSPARKAFIIEAGDRGRNVGEIVLYDAGQAGPFADPEGDRQRELKALELQIKMKADAYKRTRDAALVEALRDLGKRRDALATNVAQGEGKRLRYTLRPVSKETASDPRLIPLVEAYDQKLAMLNVAHAPTPPPPAEGNAFIGGSACVDCHEEAQQVWETTPHARAWQTLVDANKTFDAECVSCHVTGWLQPGGVSLKDLRNLKDVQCEACHGPSERHVDVGGDEASVILRSTEAMCKTCHNEHHSPKFDFDTYLPKVLGPGHQQIKIDR